MRSDLPKPSVIYDFGMNDGGNLEYYLSKAPKVVGVDAHPAMCTQVRRRFRSEIASGRLVVLHAALTDHDADAVTFYTHKSESGLSKLVEPEPHERRMYEPVEVPARTPASIISEHGDPFYIKIDVEYCDTQVLNNLFAAGIFPPEVSAEALSASVFATLVANGYTAFNLVAGEAIAKHGFNRNSAGPFGQDIWTPWEDADTFLYTLASAFLGWRDIHASRTVLPEHRPSDYAILLRQAKAIPRYLVTLLRCSLQDFAGAIGAKLSWRR